MAPQTRRCKRQKNQTSPPVEQLSVSVPSSSNVHNDVIEASNTYKDSSPKARNNFSINISSFNGEPRLLKFFQNQILDLQYLNRWSEKETIVFIRSKLTGAALDFYLANSSLHNANKVEDIFDAFSAFFQEQESKNPIIEFDRICLKPQETISQFVLRLDSLVTTLYPSLSVDNQNTIKYNKFIANIDNDTRLYLLQNNIKGYQEAVQKAIFFNNIKIQNKAYYNADFS